MQVTNMSHGLAIAAASQGSMRAGCRGVGAFPWWPLSRIRDDPRARALTERVERLFLSDVGDEPWVVCNRDLLRAYLAELEIRKLDLTCHVAERHGAAEVECTWLQPVVKRARWLGIDVAYCSGSFSFVESARSSGVRALRGFLDARLNRFGLFEREGDAEQYLVEYRRALESGEELETLDSAVLLRLWEDEGARTLRAVL